MCASVLASVRYVCALSPREHEYLDSAAEGFSRRRCPRAVLPSALPVRLRGLLPASRAHQDCAVVPFLINKFPDFR